MCRSCSANCLDWWSVTLSAMVVERSWTAGSTCSRSRTRSSGSIELRRRVISFGDCAGSAVVSDVLNTEEKKTRCLLPKYRESDRFVDMSHHNVAVLGNDAMMLRFEQENKHKPFSLLLRKKETVSNCLCLSPISRDLIGIEHLSQSFSLHKESAIPADSYSIN